MEKSKHTTSDDKIDYFEIGRDKSLKVVQDEIDRLGFNINEQALRDSLERIREQIRNLRWGS